MKKLVIAAIGIIVAVVILLFVAQRSVYQTPSSSTLLKGSPAQVWHVLTDIPYWADWWPEVKSAGLKGPIKVGSELNVEVRNGEGAWVATLTTVEPLKQLSWLRTDDADSGMKLTFDVKPVEGGTELVLTQSMAGLEAALAKMNGGKDLIGRQESIVEGFGQQFAKKFGPKK